MNLFLKMALLFLKQLNCDIEPPVFSKQEELEEQDNIADYKTDKQNLNDLLFKLEKVDLEDLDEVEELLVSLCMNIDNHIWYIEQVQELTKKMLEHYQKDKKIIVNESGKVAES